MSMKEIMSAPIAKLQPCSAGAPTWAERFAPGGRNGTTDDKQRRSISAPPPVQFKLRCLHHFFHPLFHLLRRYILDVSGNAPEMSEWILNKARAVSVELVLHRLQKFRALGRRFLNYAIDVGKVYIQAHRTRADRSRAGVALPHAGIFVGQHDVRVADLQFGVTDLAVRAIHANGFSRSEDFLVILNRLGSALDDQIGCDSVVVFWDIRYFAHDLSPQECKLEVEGYGAHAGHAAAHSIMRTQVAIGLKCPVADLIILLCPLPLSRSTAELQEMPATTPWPRPG